MKPGESKKQRAAFQQLIKACQSAEEALRGRAEFQQLLQQLRAALGAALAACPRMRDVVQS